MARSVGIVANGGLDFDLDALKRLMGRVPQQDGRGKPAALDALTERQTEVLALMAKRRKNKRIARELNISNSTVKNEVARIKEKFSLNSRTELGVYAQQQGLLDCASKCVGETTTSAAS